ncbi:hypothetical protein, partial [Chitinophaga sp. GbtcB8]|uniref:hypothetical protein n=1 Tax=Chitinophaga sp. GbtcB8 TaxID=2824753 RepID=UPI001C2FFD29
MQDRIDNLGRKAATPRGPPRGTARLPPAGSDNFFVVQASSTNNDAGLRLSSLPWAPGQPLRPPWHSSPTGVL